MALFGKKNEELEDEDDLVGEEEGDRKLTRKFKDLAPQNKRNRKEPPKPWGKRERYLVLIITIATVLISGALFVMSKPNYQLPIYEQLSVVNFHFPNMNFNSLNIFKEEAIEIKKR